MNQKFPRVTMEIINQKIEKKPTKIKEEKTRRKRGKNLKLIYKFNHLISKSRAQNIKISVALH